MSARQSFRAEAGFTIAEMLIACAIMLTVTGAVFSLLNPSEGVYKAQPEVSDMQQRMRVGVDTLTKDLMMAGAGTYTGTSAGALVNFFAPIMPYRLGSPVNDPSAGIYFRPDAISLFYVPPTPSQTTISDAMPQPSRELKVNPRRTVPRTSRKPCAASRKGCGRSFSIPAASGMRSRSRTCRIRPCICSSMAR
jgi:hypothetical protein